VDSYSDGVEVDLRSPANHLQSVVSTGGRNSDIGKVIVISVAGTRFSGSQSGVLGIFEFQPGDFFIVFKGSKGLMKQSKFRENSPVDKLEGVFGWKSCRRHFGKRETHPGRGTEETEEHEILKVPATDQKQRNQESCPEATGDRLSREDGQGNRRE